MRIFSQKFLKQSLLVSLSIVIVLPSFSQFNWDNARRKRVGIKGEGGQIRRQNVTINQNIRSLDRPVIFKEDLDLDRARRMRADQKTDQLIVQIRRLLKRERQKRRIGELNMRLAELYYDKSNIIAARESLAWEKRLKSWEKLSSAAKRKRARPQLKTPKANAFRNSALKLYSQLESQSRGRDAGRSQFIRRDEVLFYLASTYLDIRKPKTALPYFRELTKRFPNSERAFEARLNLADLYFSNAKFKNAIPQYLMVASGKGAPRDLRIGDYKIYALYKLGWSYSNIQEYSKAIKAFRKTISLSRKSRSSRKIVFEKEAYQDLAVAYAQAGKYSEGQKYFLKVGSKRLLDQYRRTAAEIARGKGHYKVARYFYGLILKENPNDPSSRQLALDNAEAVRLGKDRNAYAAALKRLLKDYGAGSSWLRAQKLSKSEKQDIVSDNVRIVRKAAKDLHLRAQRENRRSLYAYADPIYKVYLQYVPKPNRDSAANVHEMKFYYAELLYDMGAYSRAALAYDQVGPGKYKAVSAYNKILAYKEAAKKDKKYSQNLFNATEEFVKNHPKDKRVGQLLYSSAAESYKAGSAGESLKTLRSIVQRFPDSKKGVDAAERILFIHEKENSYQAAVRDSDNFLTNNKLMARGGSKLKRNVLKVKERASFKIAENLPERSLSDFKNKSKTFLKLGPTLADPELKEKAYNNANVYAVKSGDQNLKQEARAALLRAFPSSQYAKGVYLGRADELAKEGRFKEALKAYQTYLSRYKKQGKEREAAEYNVLVIRAHHEDVVIPEFQPKKSLSSSLKSSIQAFLKKYPRNPNRPFLLRVLSFRRGVSTRDISSYRKYSRLSREERKLLDEAEMLIQARSGSTSVKKKLIKNNRPGRSYTELQKTALGKTAYNFLAGDYRNYQQTKISYTPSAFAKSLEKKLSRLEKLEKEYLKVVQYGDREYSLLSLVRISEMYRTLANDIRKSPENKKELEGFAAPLEQKANEFVKLCLDKATELRLAGGSLSQCRKLNYEHKIDRSYIHLVKALKPQWLPSNYAKSKFKLLNLASSSFKKTNFGSYLLAVNQMKRTGELRESYVEESVKNMQGLLDWRYSKGQLAERSFRQVALDSGDKDLRRVAVKNLAALALKVGDASTASDILDEYRGPKDFEIELFRGVSKVASGQYKDAIGHLNTAYKNSRGSEAVALYNKALAQFALNQKSEAIKTMNLYLARARPSSGDISRTILRDWRKK